MKYIESCYEETNQVSKSVQGGLSVHEDVKKSGLSVHEDVKKVGLNTLRRS
ncbi:hypothetical protein PRUPE_7G085500 [Prunus persica]|uniref:Uncharacterized protein n=1 Tax=Prunus persica TaxID=3760 RepID=A0A251N8P9_PRUPE|nr:hypothetical protein PRUPE_7G085500 [Prunus persica]